MDFRIKLALLGTAAASAACTMAVYQPAPGPTPEPEPAAVVAPPVSGDVSFFYDLLEPYGSWTTVAGYGQVWVPRVNPWWRPYTEGRWVYTEDGWTWDSSEPFGWATFHYGRWLDDPQVGWVWVPGTVWGPAWVAWRSGGGRVGWAPLPPSVRWQVGFGFSGGVDFAAVIAPTHWCFVEDRYMTAPAIRAYVAPRARNVSYVNVTNNITNYTVINNRIVDRSVDVDRIERATRQPVPRYRIVDETSPAAANSRSLRADELPMVRRVAAVPPPETGRAPSWGRESSVAGRETARPASDTRPVGLAANGDGTLARTAPPAAVHVENTETINRRYDAERRALAAHQAEQLQVLERERTATRPGPQTAAGDRARYLAEKKALAQEQEREKAVLANRHKLELKRADEAKAKAERKSTPPPKRRSPGGADQP